MQALYPTLNEQYSLLLNPDGGELINMSRERQIGKMRKRLTVNRSAATFISMLDGKTDLSTRLRELEYLRKQKGKTGTGSTQILQLIEQLSEKNAIDIFDSPVERANFVKGSFQRITPQGVTIEMTDNCNLVCKHCYRNAGPGMDNYLPWDVLQRAIEDFYEMGVKTIEMTGGDPTMHPHFDEALQQCVERFDLVAVITNGIELSDRAIKLLSRENTICQIDLDGSTPEMHDELRGVVGAHAGAINAARKLNKQGARFRVAMSVHQGNVHQVEAVAQQAQELGAQWFGASPIVDVGRASSSLKSLNMDEMRELVSAIERLQDCMPEEFIRMEPPLPDSSNEIHHNNCGAGSRSITLAPNGDLRPCAMYEQKYISFGNITEESVEEIFTKDIVYKFSTLPAPQRAICGDCRMYSFCGGCFARPPQANEKLKNMGKQHFCRWNHVTGFSELLNRMNPYAADFDSKKCHVSIPRLGADNKLEIDVRNHCN